MFGKYYPPPPGEVLKQPTFYILVKERKYSGTQDEMQGLIEAQFQYSVKYKCKREKSFHIKAILKKNPLAKKESTKGEKDGE